MHEQTWSNKAAGGKGQLEAAVKGGVDGATETRLDESVARILNLRFITGQFDPAEGQPYTKIGAEAVNSTFAQQLNLEAALQSFVLLKNDAPASPASPASSASTSSSAAAPTSAAAAPPLPMAKGKKTAVIGPHVHSTRDLMSDYKVRR